MRTPIPWRVSVNPFGKTDDDSVDNIFILDPDGSAVAIIAKHPVWNHLEQRRMDNAEFIVCAVNCHDDLLAACELALKRLGAPVTHYQDAYAALTAAIAKVKGA